jgi:negative regulator of flagellin synthesis FlgM
MNVRNDIENLSQILSPLSAPVAASGKGGSTAAPEGTGTDTAQVSSVATQVAQSANASDVRLDKVASIQAALQAGTYQVPASAVAQSVIGAMLTPEK